jgi:hypothetical protein
MKKFFGALKKTVSILAAVNNSPVGGLLIGSIPFAGKAVEIVDRVIVQAEGKFTEPKSGLQKFDFAMELLESHGPDLIGLYEQASGKEIINEEAFERAMGHMIKARVELANAFEKKQ